MAPEVHHRQVAVPEEGWGASTRNTRVLAGWWKQARFMARAVAELQGGKVSYGRVEMRGGAVQMRHPEGARYHHRGIRG